MAMRWKLDPRPTGLSSVGAGPRSSTLRESGAQDYIATVSALRGGWRGPVKGWYFVVIANPARGLPYENTCNSPVPTMAEAKKAAVAYIKGFQQ